MIVRALDVNGDWEFGKGRNNYKRNRDAVAQNIQTRLMSFIGDCFFQTNAGIDWFNLLGSKNQVGLNLAINATILNTLYVTEMKQLSLVVNTDRLMRATYSVNTSFGFIVNATTEFSPSSVLLTEGGVGITTEEGNPIESQER